MYKSSIYYSIIIPAYNSASSIEKTIESVINQTYQNFEIVVVDDGSIDDTVGRVRSISQIIINLISIKHSGVSEARRTGIYKAKYPYLAFLDSDDEWDANYLFKVTQLINKFPDCGLFATNYWISGIGRSKIQTKSIRKERIIQDYYSELMKGYPFCSSSVIIKKEKLEIINPFPKYQKFGEDTNTWIQLAAVTKFAYTEEVLVKYNHDQQNFSDAYSKRLAESELFNTITLRKLAYRMKCSGRRYENIEKLYVYYRLKLLNRMISMKMFKRVRALLKERILFRFSPFKFVKLIIKLFMAENFDNNIGV